MTKLPVFDFMVELDLPDQVGYCRVAGPNQLEPGIVIMTVFTDSAGLAAERVVDRFSEVAFDG